MATTTNTRTRRPAAAKAADTTPAKAADATPAQEEATTTEETTTAPHAALATKPPTELHERMAAWMTEQTGVEITPKQAQVVSVLREVFRTSDAGKEQVAARKQAAAQRKQEELKAKKAAAEKKVAELQALLAE